MTDMFIKTGYQLGKFSGVLFPFFSIILHVKYIIFCGP